MGVSICSPHRLALLEQLAEQGVRAVPGNIAEVGVFKGGSAKLLAQLFSNKIVHLFDTFTGMPDIVCEFDNHHKAGDFADCSLEQVQQYLNDCPNVIIHAGVFPDTAVGLGPEERFALVHVDCDLYQSVRSCCEFFFPRLSHGGVLVFDDYHTDTCLGAKRAVDEFFAGRSELLVCENACCYARKP